MLDVEDIVNRHEHLMLYEAGDGTVEGDLVGALAEVRKLRSALHEIRDSGAFTLGSEIDVALSKVLDDD